MTFSDKLLYLRKHGAFAWVVGGNYEAYWISATGIMFTSEKKNEQEVIDHLFESIKNRLFRMCND